jgi:hypothetical protein
MIYGPACPFRLFWIDEPIRVAMLETTAFQSVHYSIAIVASHCHGNVHEAWRAPRTVEHPMLHLRVVNDGTIFESCIAFETMVLAKTCNVEEAEIAAQLDDANKRRVARPIDSSTVRHQWTAKGGSINLHVFPWTAFAASAIDDLHSSCEAI